MEYNNNNSSMGNNGYYNNSNHCYNNNGNYNNYNKAMPNTPPKSYMLESILVTIFCCRILGIIGIFFALKVEDKFYVGDYYGSERAAKTAKKCVIWGVVSGIIIYAITIIIIFIYIKFIINATGTLYSI